MKFNGTTGGIDIAFRNLIAGLYSQDLSDKVRSGKDTKTRSGKVIATYPTYGYDKDPSDHHKFVLNPKESAIVKRVFDLAAEGVSVAEIIRILNADNVPTMQASKQEKGFKTKWGRGDCWGRWVISKMLRDEQYTGKLIWGKTRVVALGSREIATVPRSEWIIVPGAIPAIVTNEQFELVQKKLAEKSKPHRNEREHKPVFYRNIKCGDCGRAMSYRARKNGMGLYLCTMHLLSDKYVCKTGKIEERDLYDAVLKTIQVQAALAITEKTLQKSKTADLLNTADAICGKIRAMQISIEKVKAQKVSLWEQLYGAKITRDKYHKENEKLTARIAEYEKTISALEADARKIELDSGQENIFVERYSKFSNIQSLTREMVNELVKEIRVYSPDRIEIVMNYADEFEKLQSSLPN